MDIRIEQHTLERAEERGTDEREIRDVLETGFEIPAKYERSGKAKIYEYNQERQEKTMPKKKSKLCMLKKKGR